MSLPARLMKDGAHDLCGVNRGVAPSGVLIAGRITHFTRGVDRAALGTLTAGPARNGLFMAPCPITDTSAPRRHHRTTAARSWPRSA